MTMDDERMRRVRRAKDAYTSACEAFLAGEPEAERLCREALAELQAAQQREQVRTVPGARR